MAKDINQLNKRLAQAAGNINPSQDQMAQFAQLVGKYKNKSIEEIEKEMYQMMDGFTREQKNDFIKKLQMLKQMPGILDKNQMQKVDMFIRLLSQ
ncbi:MAG: hypothetical protein AB2421_08520 [Thermotaleaceae bacterium]